MQLGIRFGLGAIKAVGFAAMRCVVEDRKKNGKFIDIYEFAERIDSKLINKKSIEALGKGGIFDKMHPNRRQISESFDIISSYSAEKEKENLSNQMSLFDGIESLQRKPELKLVKDWNKLEKLQKEFESFGFFLNEHPFDEFVDDLKNRGVIFSNKITEDSLKDRSLVKMAGVVAKSKHKSGSNGRFAYLTISDPFGIFEVNIFDESLITNSRDKIVDGSSIVAECMIKKDDGGSRILVREIHGLNEFLSAVKPKQEAFEDIVVLGGGQRKNKKDEEIKVTIRNDDKKIDKADQPKNNHSNPITAPYKSSAFQPALRSIKIVIFSDENLDLIKEILTLKLNKSGDSRVYILIGRREITLMHKFYITKRDVAEIESVYGVTRVVTS